MREGSRELASMDLNFLKPEMTKRNKKLVVYIRAERLFKNVSDDGQGPIMTFTKGCILDSPSHQADKMRRA